MSCLEKATKHSRPCQDGRTTEVKVGWLRETQEGEGTEGRRWSLCGARKHAGTSQSWSDPFPEVGETLSSKIDAIKD